MDPQSQFRSVQGQRKHLQRKGYLRIEGRSWLFTWREYLVANTAGRRRTEVLGPDSWPKERARDEADKILARVNGLNMRPSLRMTIAEFVVQKFEPQVISRREAGGKKHYRYLLRKHILPYFGEVQLCDVGPEHVEALIAQKHLAGYSSQTLTHIKYAISSVFEHAAHLRVYLERNPARGVELPAGCAKKRPTYSSDQLSKVLLLLKSPIYEMVLLSTASSLGPAELCGIRRKHANLTGRVSEVEGEFQAPYSISVRENFYEGKRGPLKTGARRRNIPLTAKLARSLAALGPKSLKHGPEAPLFQSQRGTPIDAHNVSNRIFGPMALELGFKVSWYAFRRAHSTLAAITGASLDDRKLMMGHSNDRMTRYYDIADIERMRAVPERILRRVRRHELQMKRTQVIELKAVRKQQMKAKRAHVIELRAKAG